MILAPFPFFGAWADLFPSLLAVAAVAENPAHREAAAELMARELAWRDWLAGGNPICTLPGSLNAVNRHPAYRILNVPPGEAPPTSARPTGTAGGPTLADWFCRSWHGVCEGSNTMESRQRDPSAYTAVRAQIDPAAAALIELVEDEPAYAPARAAYLAQLQQFPTPPWT